MRARVCSGSGSGPGDRVVAYLPNIPETLVAFLATASLGAIWATCPPEFGVRSVLTGSASSSRRFCSRSPATATARSTSIAASRWPPSASGLPSLETVVHVPYARRRRRRAPGRGRLGRAPRRAGARSSSSPLPFAHPLYVLFSSGHDRAAEGDRPRPRRHPARAPEEPRLQLGPAAGDRLQWFTTTAWMMWNALVSMLLLRASIVMIDGNPAYPDLVVPVAAHRGDEADVLRSQPRVHDGLPQGGARAGSAASTSRRCAWSARPARRCRSRGTSGCTSSSARTSTSTSAAGGTDVCTGIVQGYPLLPVYAGEMSARMPGRGRGRVRSEREPRRRRARRARHPPADAVDAGRVLERPRRLALPRAAYFEYFPGVWRFGDWILFTERGSSMITGRSDATLNRGGVRLGTSEMYSRRRGARRGARQPRRPPRGDRTSCCCSSCSVRGSSSTTSSRRGSRALRDSLSPRHAPDTVVAVPAIPRTLTGKKLEVPVKRILTGVSVEEVVSKDSSSTPTRSSRSPRTQAVGRADDAPSSRPRARADGRPRRDRRVLL